MTITKVSPQMLAGHYREPLNINPNWLLDQINEGALYTVNTTAVRGPDGWTGNATGTGVFKLRTLVDPDDASKKCLEISCTTADAAIAAGDNYNIVTAIEGYDVSSLGAGTANAQSITLMMKVKSNAVTGVFGIAVQNSATNRRYIGTITIADTAEHDYSLTLTLDTSGTWLYTNGIGLQVFFTLAAGATFQANAGAWAAGAEQTTAAQANFMSANTNIIYLKRFHVVAGASVPSAYAPADFRKELAKAQRSYCKSFVQGTAVAQNSGSLNALSYLVQVNGTTAGYAIYVNWPVDMRATPTVTGYNPSAANANWRNSITAADSAALTVTRQTSKGAMMNNFQVAGDLASHTCFVHWSADARLT